MITVIDVMRELDVEITPDLAWAVGSQVRSLYEQQYGELPQKALRPKTNAGGTHCFAIYPNHMRGDIARIVQLHKVDAARQMKLF